MDYSLLLGVHYRAPHNLRSLMAYNQSLRADGLGIVVEKGELHSYPATDFLQYSNMMLFELPDCWSNNKIPS